MSGDPLPMEVMPQFTAESMNTVNAVAIISDSINFTYVNKLVEVPTSH